MRLRDVQKLFRTVVKRKENGIGNDHQAGSAGPGKGDNAFNSYLSQDLLGGPKLIKMCWVINLHKFLTVFVVVLLMILFDNYSTAAWVYMALHGSYGFCWLVKHVVFPDPKWETRATFGGAMGFGEGPARLLR